MIAMIPIIAGKTEFEEKGKISTGSLLLSYPPPHENDTLLISIVHFHKVD
jgi:hypothetical protein